jgi:hypothetical protein
MVMLLDTHELRYCEEKRLMESYLWAESQFKAVPQELRRDAKTRLCIQHRSLDLPLGIQNVETLMKQMGFIRTENIEERLEFMKFWQILIDQEK